MVSRTSWLRLVPVLVIVLLLSGPTAVQSQCANVAGQMTMTDTATPSFIAITKTLAAAANCMTTAMNALGCGESPASPFETMLTASALTGTMTPYCQWLCTCGGRGTVVVRTDSSDGLPVELMEFAIEAD